MSGSSTAARLAAIARREPHRLAILDDDGPVDYGQFHHRLLRCAQVLAGAGFRAGDRVAVGGPALGRELLVLLAVEGLGGVTASFGTSGDDVAPALLRHVQWVAAASPQPVPDGARFLLLDDAFVQSLDQPLGTPAPGWVEVAAQAPARLARTSGSTGAPKFLLHPRVGHDWWIDSLLRPGLVQGPHARMLVLCPLLVGGAFARASACLRSGAAVLGGVHLDLDRLRPNLLVGMSLHVERFLDALPHGVRLPVPIATVILGGSVPAVLRERITTVLRGRIENTYGSNEAGPVAAQADGRGEGPLVPQAEVRILDDAGNDLPAGELGTIAVRTPIVGQGYLGDEAASAAYRGDGWFLTSDIGVLVRPGVLRLLGRRDDLLVIGGLKIAAGVLDERLARVPSVAAGAVLSVQLDGVRSTLGVALVLAPGCTLAQAQADLSPVLADVAGLGIRLLAVKELPRLPGGKLDRAALLRQFLAQAGRSVGRGCTAAQLGAIALREPHRLAIHDDDGPVSYGELDHRVQRCAQVLAALGLRAGDRVAIGGPGLARQVVVTLAVEGLGGVTASFTVEGDASAAALFRHVQWVVAGQRPDVPAGVRFVAMDEAFVAGWRQPLDGPALRWVTPLDAAPVRLARTSGSTGASKFLLQSWRGHDWSIDVFASSLAGGRDARLLLLSPLLVGGAYPRVSACLRAGAAVLAAEHIVLDAMRPTCVFGLPAHLDWFVNAIPAGFVMPAPVAASVAGGSLPRPLRERLEAMLGGPVNNTLGSNEAGPICFHLDAEGIGTLVPGVEVRILDEDGREVPDGQPGILALRTPLVGTGYLEPPGDASGYRDGWFVTSDVCARVGSERLRLFGRRDDLLVLAGLKVPASAVEDQLLALPAVAAAAVQSVRLDGGRTTLGVAIVLAAGHTGGQAHAQVSAALADIAALGIRLLVLERMPRLAGGKVDRPALLQRFLAITPS